MHLVCTLLILVDVSDIFNFFFARGGERGESEAPGAGGCRFLLKFQEGGGVFRRGRGRGAGKVSAANWWGGGGG